MTHAEKLTTPLCRLAGIKLVHYQPNIKTREPDCAIRAISRLLNISWEESMTLLYNAAIEKHTMLNNGITISKVLIDNGYKRRTFRNTHMTISRFIMENRKGRYYLINNNHAVACINSTIYDSNFMYYDAFVSSELEVAFIKK